MDLIRTKERINPNSNEVVFVLMCNLYFVSHPADQCLIVYKILYRAISHMPLSDKHIHDRYNTLYISIQVPAVDENVICDFCPTREQTPEFFVLYQSAVSLG